MEPKLRNSKGVKNVIIIGCVVVGVITLIVYFVLMLTAEKG